MIERYDRLVPYMDTFVIVDQPAEIEAISSTAVRKHFFHVDEIAFMLHPAVAEIMKTLRKEDFPEEILRLKNQYVYLDPAYPSKINFEGITYPSAEAAFHASKLKNPEERRPFTLYNTDKMKQRGAAIIPYAGWEETKVDLMMRIQKAKFIQNEELMERLLRSGNKRIIAGNSRKEQFWGVNLTSWEGENHLGRILMQLRAEYNTKRKEIVHEV